MVVVGGGRVKLEKVFIYKVFGFFFYIGGWGLGIGFYFSMGYLLGLFSLG